MPAISNEEGTEHSAVERESKTYTAQQFFDSTSFGLGSSGGHVFTSDDAHVLINSDSSGVFNAYLLPLSGGEPVALTDSTTNAIFASSLFPDDNRVIYSSDSGGDELSHVYLRELDGTVRDLTPGEGHTASFAGWSGDDDSFYISTNERDAQAFDVYIYDAAEYSRELLFENPGNFFPGSVSDDGRWMVLSRNNSSADSDLFLIDLKGDVEPKLITEHEGSIRYGSYGFPPTARN